MNIDKKFLLVCLQLIIALLLMSMNVEGMPNMRSLSESSSPMLQQPFFKERTSRNERAYRLYNQCACKEVLIQDKVSATANGSDDRGDLVLETTMKRNDVRIRIRGLTSGKYLCYNRRGKLQAKPKEKARGARCEFIEVPSGQYWSYKSAVNKRWYMGFDRKGRSLYGSDHVATDRPDCFRFAKNVRVADQLVAGYLIKNHFNVDEHNRQIGQIHPHLKPEYYSDSSKTTLQLPSSSFPTETTTIQPQPHHPLRHHRNQGKSHHLNPRPRHLKKSQRNRKSSSISSLPKTVKAADR